MRISSLASLGPGALDAICEGLGDKSLSIRLLAGIDVDSAAPSHAMWELGRVAAASAVVSDAFAAGPDQVLDRLAASDTAEARDFLARFDQFLFDHGSRAQNEYDICSLSWEVKPRIALAAIDLMRRSDESQAPASRNVGTIAERDRVAAEIREKIAGDPETAGLFEAAMGSARVFLSGRERAKTNVVMVINEMRVALREFGRRLVERGVIDEVGQVFMVTSSELDRLRHEPETLPRRHPAAIRGVPIAVRLRAGVHRERHRARAVGHAPTRRGIGARTGRRCRADRRRRLRRRGHRAGTGRPRCRRSGGVGAG